MTTPSTTLTELFHVCPLCSFRGSYVDVVEHLRLWREGRVTHYWPEVKL